MNCIQKPKLFRYIPKPKRFYSNFLHFPLALFICSFFAEEAQAQGLQKAKGILELIQKEVLGIVPIIAAIILVCMGIGYATGSVQKETFMRWAAGLIIVGSAAQLTTMLLG